jgi:hypothetical protein
VVGGLDLFDDDERPEGGQEKGLREVNDFLIEFSKKNPLGKPLVVSMDLYGNDLYCADNAAQLRRKFVTSGVPAYPSLESAARAMARFINYHEFQKTHGNPT